MPLNAGDGIAMAITKHLAGRAFSPEQVEQLTAAYEGALAELQITNRDNPVTELIARKIIEVSDSDGTCTPAILYTRALAQLGFPASRHFLSVEQPAHD
jgi:hypothetical protein